MLFKAFGSFCHLRVNLFVEGWDVLHSKVGVMFGAKSTPAWCSKSAFTHKARIMTFE